MRAVVIINDKAGTPVNKGADNLIEEINNQFNAAGSEAEVILISDGDCIPKIKQAVEENYDVIAAAGGDGTISSVAAELVNKNIPLGVIPFGTLNHFAKDLNIPLTIKEAIENILKMKTARIDVGAVNGKYFINNSSIGLYPKVVKHRKNETERLGGKKWLAMGKSILRVFKIYPLFHTEIKLNGKIIKGKTPFIFVGNNEYQFDLFNLGSRLKLNEGFLSVYIPKTSNRLALLKFTLLGLINKLRQEKNFITSEAEEFKINSSKKILEVALDGEVVHLAPPLNYKCIPESLNVIVP
jgi:YegS/Rv2252/BmrU family lipid kinase